MKFMIICRQRSGSGLLRSYLNSHPDLKCIMTELTFMTPDHFKKYVDYDKKIKKYLKPQPFKKQIVDPSNPESIKTMDRTVNRYNKKIFPFAFYNCLPNNIGFDTKYNAIAIDDSTRKFISDNNQEEKINIIHLMRKNIFEQALSRWIEMNQHITHRPTRIKVGDLKKKKSTKKFKVNKKEIIRSMKKIKEDRQEWTKKLKSISNEIKNVRILTLYYEDIIDADQHQRPDQKAELPSKIMKKICKFLEIDEPERMTSDRVKVNSKNYQDYIINWNEIKKLNV